VSTSDIGSETRTSATAGRRGGARAHRGARSHLAELPYLLPVAVLLAAFTFVPAAIAWIHAFTAWNPGYDSPFIGLDNFRALFADPTFREVLGNQVIFLLGVPLWVLLPLALSLLLYERVPAVGIFRTILFFPAVLPPTIIAIMFRSLLAPDGLVNDVLRTVGLGNLAQPWLDSADLVKISLILLLAWAGLGVGVVMFGAALSSVPVELFEAAALDGANFPQRLRFVVIPGIRGTIVLYTVLQVLTVFLFLFAWIYVLTNGGPGFASTTMDFDIFERSMAQGFFGVAAAESIVLVGCVAVLILAGWACSAAWKRLA
jgi:ABC-type sugar transport system permease subunit